MTKSLKRVVPTTVHIKLAGSKVAVFIFGLATVSIISQNTKREKSVNLLNIKKKDCAQALKESLPDASSIKKKRRKKEKKETDTATTHAGKVSMNTATVS